METSYPQKSDRYMEYREMLLSKGFSEAKQNYGRFFRQATEQTAFVVNCEEDDESCITIMYGFTSTAYMAGDEDWFSNHGSDIEDCQVRNILCVWDSESETDARKRISDFYEQYKNHAKDEILSVKKERQKRFLDHFARALKPLGFIKKGTKWTRALMNSSALTFHAQKSAFSDQYYFNVTVHNASNFYTVYSHERVVVLTFPSLLLCLVVLWHARNLFCMPLDSGILPLQPSEKMAALAYTNIVEFGGINNCPGKTVSDKG